MSERPIIVLGAGATKACGGPLTHEILPAALNEIVSNDQAWFRVEDRENLLRFAREFLVDCFNVPPSGEVGPRDCPPLPLVLSMLRRCVGEQRAIGRWRDGELVQARRAIEYAIFAVIEAALHRIPADRSFHTQLLAPLYERGVEPVVISLNYDVIADNTMFRLGAESGHRGIPDYLVDFATDQYQWARDEGTFGRLLKIHGSMNWLYCERCQRLDIFVSRSLADGMRTAKALDDLYHQVRPDDAYSCQGTRCRNTGCGGFVGPVMITPTYQKDYENPHVARLWEEARRALRAADRAVFVGYSMPPDDLDVALLFKQGLDHLPPDRITVVEHVAGDDALPPEQRTALADHEVGRRYRSLFGSGLDWQTNGFAGWLAESAQGGRFRFAS